MQAVSTSWKESQRKTVVPESFIEIELGLVDPAIQENTTPSADVVYFSNIGQILEKDLKVAPYVTLEQNLWLLDGKKQILPTDNYGNTGYIGSALSGADGRFDPPPVVSVQLPWLVDVYLPGLTLEWDQAHGDYAVDFDINLYNGEILSDQIEVRENTNVFTPFPRLIKDFDRVDIVIYKWSLPHKRPRISKMLLTIHVLYDTSNIISLSHTQESDILSSRLPKTRVRFSVDNVDDSYNPYNPRGLTAVLMERQELKIRYGYKVGNDIEWIPAATVYLSEWNAPQNGLSVEFEATDILGFLDKTFMKGLYRPDGISLKDLAEEVLLDADLPLVKGEVPWKLHESLDNIYTVAPLPLVRHSECLQMIANAAGCAMYVDREGFLHIEPIAVFSSEDYFRMSGTFYAGQSSFLPRSLGTNWKWTDYRVDNFNSYKYPEVKLSKVLQQVDVTVYTYFTENDSKEIYKGDIEVHGTETMFITYTVPAVDVSISVSGGTLNSVTYYTNACQLTLTGEGLVTVVITGKELKTSETVITVPTGERGEIQPIKNPLVTDTSQARRLATWARNILINRRQLTLNWRADPRLDVLDRIYVQNKYGFSPLHVTRLTYDYKGSFKGKAEGRDIG